MRYLLLIYSSAESWNAMSPRERRALNEGHAVLSRQLQASGELVHAGGLTDPSLATTVRVHGDDDIEATDGPFAEAKEHLAGYYVVDVADRQAAVAIAARIPDARHLAVEVRAIADSP